MSSDGDALTFLMPDRTISVGRLASLLKLILQLGVVDLVDEFLERRYLVL